MRSFLLMSGGSAAVNALTLRFGEMVIGVGLRDLVDGIENQ